MQVDSAVHGDVAKEPAVSLLFDAKALSLIERAPSSHGLLLTINSNYGMPGALVCAEWCSRDYGDHDPDVVLLETISGRPVFAHRRLAAFARFQTLRLTTRGTALWHALVVERAEHLWIELVRWEYGHPRLARTWDQHPAA
ncbi:MAG: hypothetical protein M1118_08520 [Chloroflexi bacterium]|nr:hypothetical protein [Chloroflexota bacterium]